MQKLDSFNKIILATGTINYLASMIEGLNSDMKRVPDPEKVHAEGIAQRDADMEAALDKLKDAMEILGNSVEEPCAIDVYVTTPAFMVVKHGHDDVEGDFDNLD